MSSPAAWLFRAVKILVALSLIAVSLWALLLPPLFPASSRSVVNAHSIRIEAATPGIVEELTGRDRRPVWSGERIASLTRDQQSLERELDSLQFTLQTLMDRSNSLDVNITLRKQEVEKSRVALSSTRRAIEQSLRRRQEEASSKVELYGRLHSAKVENVGRLRPLFEESIITQSQWYRSREEEIESEKLLQLARAELNTIQGEMENMDTGVLVGNSHGNDDILARIESYEQEIRNLEIQKLEVEADIEIVKRRIASTSSFLQDNESYILVSPVDGVIWRQNVLNGQMVLEGQSIVEIADSSLLFVEAYFDRHMLDTVSLGDTAHIYLVNDDTFIQGRVSDIQVQEQRQEVQQIINSVPPHASMLKVIIRTDEGILSTDQIGQLAKVMISSSDPGVIETAMVALSFMLRSNSQ